MKCLINKRKPSLLTFPSPSPLFTLVQWDPASISSCWTVWRITQQSWSRGWHSEYFCSSFELGVLQQLHYVLLVMRGNLVPSTFHLCGGNNTQNSSLRISSSGIHPRKHAVPLPKRPHSKSVIHLQFPPYSTTGSPLCYRLRFQHSSY
jgi:hypothetical protein